MKNQLSHYKNIWTFRLTDKDGKVLYEEQGPNNLTQLGQGWIMKSAFQKSNSSDRLFLRLANQVLAQDDLISDITTEPVGNGYTPQELTRDTVGFPSDTIVDTYAVLSSKSVEWTAAGGSIGQVSIAFLATSDNILIPDTAGQLLAYKELPVAQTILSGNTGTIYMQISLA